MRPVGYLDQYRIQKKKRLYNKAFFILGIVFIILIGAVYFFFFGGIFLVQDIQYFTDKGAQVNPELKGYVESWLNEKKIWVPRRNNLFFLETDLLRQGILDKYADIESLILDKEYSHKLNIHLKERSFTGIWCLIQQEQCFYFDKDGIAYDKSPSTSGFLVLSIKDQRSRNIKVGERVEDGEWLQAVAGAREVLFSQNIHVNEFIIPEKSFDEIHAVTSLGWKIMLSINTDIPQQITSMSSFIKRSLTADKLSALQYMDLRIDGRIYYK